MTMGVWDDIFIYILYYIIIENLGLVYSTILNVGIYRCIYIYSIYIYIPLYEKWWIMINPLTIPQMKAVWTSYHST